MTSTSECIILRAKENVISNGDISRSFETYADFGLMGDDFIKNTVKVDTGCGLSTFPYYRLTGDARLCREMKRDDIHQGIPNTFSYGVETGGRMHITPITKRAKLKNEAIKFKHRLDYLDLGGYSIGAQDVYINYDRRGNILIGMDILSQLEIAMGESQKNGGYYLIGCLKKQRDKSAFRQAIKDHFGGFI